MKQPSPRPRGFTLIELLVVIAIIGLLSAVVLASLASARQKAQGAAILSDLRSMLTTAEYTYESANSYSSMCSGNACGAPISSVCTAIVNAGGTPACNSYDGTRWGISVKFNADTSKNYAVDLNGTATWDSQGVNATGQFVQPDVQMTWTAATAACAAAGGRLPSFEELQALIFAYGWNTPPSFQANTYWTSTEVPTNSAAVYFVQMAYGSGSWNGNKTSSLCYVRCVR